MGSHLREKGKEEEKEDLFVFHDTIGGPRAPAVKPGRVWRASLGRIHNEGLGCYCRRHWQRAYYADLHGADPGLPVTPPTRCHGACFWRTGRGGGGQLY
jgi:hypothetical protein